MRKAMALAAIILLIGYAAAEVAEEEGMGDECKDAFRGISADNIAWDEKLSGIEGAAYNATGFLADKAAPLKYHVSKAFDGKLETAWAVNTPRSGVDEKLAFMVKGNAKTISILPGFGLAQYFKLNNRVESAELRVCRIKERYSTQCVSGIVPGETVSITQLFFKDEMRLQPFVLDEFSETEDLIAVLEITGVRKGSKWNDTCIAEIVVK